MKRKYIKPTIDVIKIESEGLLIGSQDPRWEVEGNNTPGYSYDNDADEGGSRAKEYGDFFANDFTGDFEYSFDF